ncbi:MAG: hypothetical protein WEE89_14195 [Gemmatimonadota bacterium]
MNQQRVSTTASRVRFTSGGHTALVVARDSVLAFDVATYRRTGAVRVAAGPKVIALSPDDRRAYITHPEGGLLTLMDVATMTVLASVTLPGTPDGVAVLHPRN